MVEKIYHKFNRMAFITRFNLVLVWSKIVQILTKNSSNWVRHNQVSWSSYFNRNLFFICILRCTRPLQSQSRAIFCHLNHHCVVFDSNAKNHWNYKKPQNSRGMLILTINSLTRSLKLIALGRNWQLRAMGKTDGHCIYYTELALGPVDDKGLKLVSKGGKGREG